MSQPPADHYPRRPSGPQRPRRRRLRKRGGGVVAIGAVLLIAIVASACGARSGNQNLSAASSAAALAASRAHAKKAVIEMAEHACGERPPASRDLYVRIVKPGASTEVQRLGGQWRWDHITGKCLTAIHFMTATAPRSAGHCTQVGYVTDNPGYYPSATPAPPLPHTAAEVGPACAATVAPPPAPSPPTQTTPAAAAPPPAPVTPAGCSPISDEGTCYEPGEYCRDDDHGVTGVAGDGETIVCEDNDGWRWEPA
jgi:hypothetical protein